MSKFGATIFSNLPLFLKYSNFNYLHLQLLSTYGNWLKFDRIRQRKVLNILYSILLLNYDEAIIKS